MFTESIIFIPEDCVNLAVDFSENRLMGDLTFSVFRRSQRK